MQLQFCIVSQSFSLLVFSKTQHNKELESDRDREKDTAEKTHVKLCKAEMTQSSKSSIIFLLSSSVVTFLDVWENGTKTNFVKQSHSSPQSVHLCLLSLRSPANQKRWSLSPWRQKAWRHHQTSFQNSSDSLAERVYFTSKVNLELYRVKVKGHSGFKMVWFSLLISLSSSLSDRANLSN